MPGVEIDGLHTSALTRWWPSMFAPCPEQVRCGQEQHSSCQQAGPASLRDAGRWVPNRSKLLSLTANSLISSAFRWLVRPAT